MNEKISPPDGLKRTVSFEGPSELGIDDNFFDQPPFQTAIWVAFQASGLPLEDIRKMTRANAIQLNEMLNPSLGRGSIEDVSEAVKLLVTRDIMRESGIKYGDEDLVKRGRTALTYINKSLLPFPFWYEYVNLIQTRNVYKNNSEKYHLPWSSTIYPTVGYGKWLEKRLRIASNTRLWGIEEIFPQDVGSLITSMPNTTGHHRGWRRWRIVTASNIARERK